MTFPLASTLVRLTVLTFPEFIVQYRISLCWSIGLISVCFGRSFYRITSSEITKFLYSTNAKVFVCFCLWFYKIVDKFSETHKWVYWSTNWAPYRTRKPYYRKDDRAMRPIYGCPENFRESLATPTATLILEIVNRLLLRWTLWICLPNLKSVALPVPEIIGVL